MKSKTTQYSKIRKDIILKLCFLIALLSYQMNYSQDSCDTALPLTAGVVTVDVIDGANITTGCSTSALAEWYIYTPTNDYSVTVTSDLSQNICKDTNFEVYTGTCGSLTCFTGDDDSGVIQCNTGNTNSYLSTKTFNVVAGTVYYIMWNNQWNTNGFDFELSEAPIPPNPCLTATPITAGITTVNAITTTNLSTSCSTSSKAEWYSYTPSQDYEVTISSDLIENICKNTNFNVYTGTCTALNCFVGDDNSGTIQCNSGNTNSYLSSKTFVVTGGITYYIAWDNKWSTDGFNFELTETAIIPPPVSYIKETVSTITSQYKLCIVDMNGDYKDDIAGVNANNLKVHYQGTTAGVFSITDFPITGTSKMPTWSLAAGDYNRDGYNDIILGNGQGLSVWTSNSTGTAYSNFTPSEYIFCQRTNFADLNNDGHLDVFSCHDIAPNVYYLNDGNGNLTYYQSSVTPGAMNLGSTGGNYSTLFTDFDNDGDTDVFISKCSGPPCELHRNDGDGVYTNISALAQIDITPIQTWSSAIADFDNDGDMDIIITASSGTHKYFQNNLDTTNNVEEAYTNITAGSGWDTNPTTNIDNVAYDFDNDGYVDVLGGGNKIMFNQGNSVFSEVKYSNGISVGAIGDLNNDGFLDILNGNVISYAVPNGNNWVKVTLEGVQSNINGIGARVEIHGSWGKQIRDIRSGEGFRYMSSLNAHFGIGTATVVNQIVIKWPSGIVDVVNNPSSNQTTHVIEGSSPLSSASFNINQVKIYPNPSSNFLSIINIETLNVKEMNIYDTTGKQVKTISDFYSSIKISDLAEGLYILTIKTEDGDTLSEQFIKTN
jgi:hypothetical protein